jgi:hypothetical protein
MQTIFVLGRERLVIDHDIVTVKKSKLLKKAIREAQTEYNKELDALRVTLQGIQDTYKPKLEHIQSSYDDNGKVVPPESDEEYEARVAPIQEEMNKELETAVPDDGDTYVHKMAFKCLKVLGREFGQEQKVTQDSFDDSLWYVIKVDLAKFLLLNEISLGELFLPPKLTETAT